MLWRQRGQHGSVIGDLHFLDSFEDKMGWKKWVKNGDLYYFCNVISFGLGKNAQ